MLWHGIHLYVKLSHFEIYTRQLCSCVEGSVRRALYLDLETRLEMLERQSEG